MLDLERLRKCYHMDRFVVCGVQASSRLGNLGRCLVSLGGMSFLNPNRFLDEWEVKRSHIAIHDWVHKADLQPLSTVMTEQLAVDEKVIHVNGEDF